MENRIIYRINCGATRDYTDKNGGLWSADQPYDKETGWGHIFGRLQSFSERFSPRYAPCRGIHELINDVPPAGARDEFE